MFSLCPGEVWPEPPKAKGPERTLLTQAEASFPTPWLCSPHPAAPEALPVSSLGSQEGQSKTSGDGDSIPAAWSKVGQKCGRCHQKPD